MAWHGDTPRVAPTPGVTQRCSSRLPHMSPDHALTKTPSHLLAGEPWFHVVHRGLGRRPIFSTAADVHQLLDLVGREAERGALQLHAYTVVTNHCHLLVRCSRRELSAALRRVFATYSRHFNRRLGRDGALFGSRVRVRRVSTVAHWRATVGYIDRNAVGAGLSKDPARYAFGSAWHYARESRPPWLRRDVVEDFVARRTGQAFAPAGYARVFAGSGATDGSSEVVERRLETRDDDGSVDPLDDLLSASPVGIRQWLERMARRADGAAAGPKLVSAETLRRALEETRRRQGAWSLPQGTPRLRLSRRMHRGGVSRDGWCVLACGLLRLLAGLTLEEIGRIVGLSVAGVHYQIECHRRMLLEDHGYKSRAEFVTGSALRLDYPDAGAGAAATQPRGGRGPPARAG